MPYTLDQFAADCRMALQDGDSPEAFEAVRQYVETALKIVILWPHMFLRMLRNHAE